MATNVVLKSGQLADLQNTSVKDGTLYVAKRDESTAELHVDLNGSRYRVSDAPAGSDLGSVKSGGDVTIRDGIITVNDNSHSHDSYVNQNAFSNVTVGSTTIAADKATDTLTIAAGANVTITPDATNDKITIAATDTTYSANSGIKLDGTTIQADLKSATKLSNDATAATEKADRVYPVALDKSGHLAVNVPWTDNNTTYTNEKLGNGYAVQTDTVATAAISASMANYNLVSNGTVVVKFTKNVPATATLNVNNKGQKAIYFNGSAITAGIILAGDTATFMYDGTNYILLSIDRSLIDLENHTHDIDYTPEGSLSETSITPAGTVTSTFTGTESSHTHTFIGNEQIHGHKFTGSEATISIGVTPEGEITNTYTTSTLTSTTPSDNKVSVATASHTHAYTPAGTISKPTFTGSEGTTEVAEGSTDIWSITGVGTLPSASITDGGLDGEVANKCLSISQLASSLTFNAGSLPSRTKVTVASSTHAHDFTPSGAVSAPTFTGTAATIGSVTGTINVPNVSHTHSIDAISAVKSTFKGKLNTYNTLYIPTGTIETAKITPSGTLSEASITPVGSVASNFVGTAASHKHTFTGTKATLTTKKKN